jgi:MFS family permease
VEPLAARDFVDEVINQPARPTVRALPPAAIVWLLGLSQIIGYGTLYYSFAILANSVSASFNWPSSWLFAALSVGLFLGGIAAPEAGRRIDRHGAGLVMSWGSLTAAAALLLAALAPNGVIFALAVVAMQIAGTLTLYDAAFAALVQATGTEARKRITHLTLIAGFASTIFWPMTVWLNGILGWREIFALFAAANLLVCLPIHALLARQPIHNAPSPSDVQTSPDGHSLVPASKQRQALWLVTLGFALSGFALSAMLAQMVPILTQLGLGVSALLVSALFGPAQVLVRFVNMLIAVRTHPIRATLIALGLVPAAIVALAVSAPAVVGAVLFALLLGFGSGLKSIVQGTLPLALFGSASYGSRLGHIAAVRQILAAFAPFALAFVAERLGTSLALWLVAIVGTLGLACMLAVVRLVNTR